MNAPDEVHIASFVLQHRAGALQALRAAVAAEPALELAIASDTRSVVVCETADRYQVMDLVDRLRELPGVLNVLLVHHHAEPADALDEPVSPPIASGASA
ncbi:chaperone NapD [Pseudoxanthomonas suwonensis]|uniref:chaperone NapD n=1 Tax=Pseudoxanthomonas suwonensis TaxID=314722 RepID=UPI00138F5AA0|nr:chaperone NapD [Pseudoxanthomonas suwonensis]KAF1701647.1 nitrate reductase formation protein NapD [Pseudoxanthomonas suwonensis]